MKTEEEIRQYKKNIKGDFRELRFVTNADKNHIMDQLMNMYKEPWSVIGEREIKIFQELLGLLIATMNSAGKAIAVDWILSEEVEKVEE